MRTTNTFTLRGRSLLLATTAGLICAGIAASAQARADDDQDPNLVAGVVVTSESAQAYKVTATRSATKTDTALVDVPQAVTVVSVKQINDQAAGSIGDAVRYVPGVFSAQGEGNRETLVLRGNSTTGDFFVDSMRDDVQTYRDLYNIERLEVFKGPNAMIFGRGGVGGLINRVTKVADWNEVRGVRAELGSFDHKRVSFDLGAPISDQVALRLTGVWQDSGSYRDGVTYERWGLNPTAAFRLGPNTVVQAGYEHFEDDRIADRGVPAHFRAATAGPVEPLNTSRGVFFGDPTNSPTWTDTDAVTFNVEHQIADGVSIRNRTRYADYDKFYQNIFPGAVTDATETTVPISAYNNATSRKNFINQTDFNAKVTTGAIEHTVLLGAEYGRQTTTNRRLEGRFAGGASSVNVPVASPNVRLPTTWVAIASSADNRGVARVAAAYAQDQIALNDSFDVVVGVRYENFKTTVHDLRTVGFPAGQQRDFVRIDKLWSPRVGLIYKPVETASIYASYSKTYLPRGGDQLTGLSLTNQNLDPEEFVNSELGAKWDVSPRLNLTAALFELERSNVLALSDPNNPASLTIPIGKQRTRGLELSAAGQVTDRLNIVAAYTRSDAEFLNNVSGTVKAGNQVAGMPKNSGSVWGRYEITDAVGAGLGVVYQGKRFASTDNLVYMPSFTRLDAAVFFKVNPQFDLQVNMENLTNEKYFLFANSNTNITPGSGPVVKVGLNARF